MALLTDNTFHSVTFLVPTDAAWAALAPNVPGTPQGIAEAIYAGDPIVIFVIDAANGAFAFEGGQGYGFDDTLIDTSTPYTNFTLDSAAPFAQSSVWGKAGPGGGVYVYDSTAGIVRQFSALETAAFKAFLP